MNQPSPSMRLPGPLPVRLLLWYVLFLAFPLSLTVAIYSLQVEVFCATTFAAHPAEGHIVERELTERGLTGRVLVRMEQSEKSEIDPWLRDDLRQSWISVSTFSRGKFPAYRDAFVDASYRMYGCHPDEVWLRIVAARKAKLGALYNALYDENDLLRRPERLPPKKPAQSEPGEIRATKAA